MSTSTITLYYRSLLTKEKNFALDDPSTGKPRVESYLSTLEKETIPGFQYIKNGLSVSIKVAKSQSALAMGEGSRDLNYVKIENEGESPKYYFVVGKSWRGEGTIELSLSMDTLNSFGFGSDYELTGKTLVKREHKARFAKIPTHSQIFEFDIVPNHVTSGTYSSMLVAVTRFRSYSIEVLSGTTLAMPAGFPKLQENVIDGIHAFRFWCLDSAGASGHVKLRLTFSVYAFQREIDERSEEINAPVYKFKEELLYEHRGDSTASWFLYYKNKDDQDGSPVECYLLADESYPIRYQTSDGIVDASFLPDSDYIILYSEDGLSVDVGGAQYFLNAEQGWAWGQFKEWSLLALKKNGANIDVWGAKLRHTALLFPPVPLYTGEWTKIGTYSGVEVSTLLDTIHTRRVDILPSAIAWCVGAEVGNYVGSDYTIAFSATASRAAYTLQDIDRTLNENIKIIDLPYSPTNFTILGDGSYALADMWKTDPATGMVKLNNSSARFKNDVQSQAVNPEIVKIAPYDGAIDLTDTKRFLKDSKLFHSDFYRPKFVYDSFSRHFPLEKMEFDPFARASYYFQFHFTASRNIVSKFMFTFDYEYKMSVEDFEKIVAVSRNNEEVLYNSSYLNYIRTGYNYDVKAKERQDAANAGGMAISALSIISSMAVAIATQNPMAGVATGAAVLGLVGQTINYAKATAQAEDNIQRKLQESRQQAVAVMNADDVDLLHEYCNNKAKLCEYRVSDQMEGILDDVFYYGGYISNERKVPDVRTRYWFNFLQASLLLKDTANLPEGIEEDLRAKFEDGVTFLHLRHGRFDFAQEMENIEKSLVGG